ncbi:uncharacterized protein BDR25DRAFT_287960 [Lindgomyces ingoldianus]|uniref:Uncharacterized protein n=1 Tax=Lindgomyces ingoldianus TaxID=673940 RepID=A0ACB6QUC3_9PLEO|nr:uncharacterized protein BDR25DRAFT_287960 [Lindgomyces ingoldianus]KAF2470183.1 hypothetical protein BDR25DRAFT_287960 [Lindgomyces ingoldianus]
MNPPKDVWQQSFTLLYSNGTQFHASIADLEWARKFGIKLSINYGSQIGASLVLLIVLLLLTKQEKRRSIIFIMNALCLTVNIIRTTLQACFLTSEYFNPYTFLSQDYSRITPADKTTTIAANTLNIILVVFVMISLSLQVWVVCFTTPKVQRFWIMFGTTLCALLAVGWRFAVTIVSNEETMVNGSMENWGWLIDAQYITLAIAIWAYCAIFTFKLGYALVQRRRLGMTQFGPMQIIFIMGCQTMILPAVFSILEFYERIPELGSQTLTIVCIFLPLSAIWAGVVASEPNIGASGVDAHQRLLGGQFGRSLDGSSVNHSKFGGGESTFTDNSMHTNSMKDPNSPTTPTLPYKEKDTMRDARIHVHREWSVKGGPATNRV